MSIISRVNRALHAFRTAPDMKAVEKQLDLIVANKEKDTASQLDVRRTDRDLAYYWAYSYLRTWTGKGRDKMPAYGSLDRDYFMSEWWRDEPILAGALYSMTAKMTALKWHVIGKRLAAKQAAQTFAQAAHMDGYEWGGFIASTAEDFYTTDRGVFWETARGGVGSNKIINRLAGGLTELGHIDSLLCWLTGNKQMPMVYYSDTTGQTVRFKQGEYVHFASMPSPRERWLGIGFCAISRAFRAATLLMGLHDYDSEKLSNLPPEGVATVTGLTMDEFQDALKLWKAARTQDNSLTFPQVLWLIGSQPGTEVNVNLQGFSSLPESFDRDSVVNHYVATLALCFGVDAREFWPVSSGSLGTAAESEIQHLKAKGKGPGEFISIVERHLNAELPEDSQFAFDTQDIQEDQIAATVAKAWIDAYWPLYQGIPNPTAAPPPPFGGSGLPTTPGNNAGQQAGQKAGARPPQAPKSALVKEEELSPDSKQSDKPKENKDAQTEQVITKEQFLRLLVEKGVLPEYLVRDERIVVSDTEVHISKEGHPDDMTKFVWDRGILKEERLPPIVLYDTYVPYAEYKGGPGSGNKGHAATNTHYHSLWNEIKLKEEKILEGMRNITGSPIPDNEAERGSRVTAKAIRDEIKRWREHPILSKYAPTDAEIEILLNNEPK